MSIEIFPEELPVIAGQLNAIQASLLGVVNGSYALAQPAPGGFNAVAHYASVYASTFSAGFFTATTMPGCSAIMSAGNDVLYPISVSYEASDMAGAGTVNSART